MTLRLTLPAVVMVSLSIASADAQDIALRLRGKVLNSAGTAIAKARVQTDATLGPQGAPFGSASRNFNATTNDKGEWGILGVTRGLWIFEGSAAGHAPLAVAVPVNMMHAEPNRPVSWQLPLRLRGGVDHRIAQVQPVRPDLQGDQHQPVPRRQRMLLGQL